jgi:hypothetical protein
MLLGFAMKTLTIPNLQRRMIYAILCNFKICIRRGQYSAIPLCTQFPLQETESPEVVPVLAVQRSVIPFYVNDSV